MSWIRICESNNFAVDYAPEKGMYCVTGYENGDLIGYPDAMYLPEAAMDEFHETVKTLKRLNYYSGNSEIK